jgi:hypothetical protein
MTISHSQVSVGTVATSLGVSYPMESTVSLHNIDNTDRIYIGGAAVTTSTGFALDKGIIMQVTIPAGDQLYAVSTKAGHVITVLQPRPNG